MFRKEQSEKVNKLVDNALELINNRLKKEILSATGIEALAKSSDAINRI